MIFITKKTNIMKQLIIFFGLFFFVTASSAQIIKKDTVKRKTIPVRTIPAKKPPVQMQAEKKPVMVEKKPAGQTAIQDQGMAQC